MSNDSVRTDKFHDINLYKYRLRSYDETRNVFSFIVGISIFGIKHSITDLLINTIFIFKYVVRYCKRRSNNVFSFSGYNSRNALDILSLSLNTDSYDVSTERVSAHRKHLSHKEDLFSKHQTLFFLNAICVVTDGFCVEYLRVYVDKKAGDSLGKSKLYYQDRYGRTYSVPYFLSHVYFDYKYLDLKLSNHMSNRLQNISDISSCAEISDNVDGTNTVSGSAIRNFVNSSSMQSTVNELISDKLRMVRYRSFIHNTHPGFSKKILFYFFENPSIYEFCSNLQSAEHAIYNVCIGDKASNTASLPFFLYYTNPYEMHMTLPPMYQKLNNIEMSSVFRFNELTTSLGGQEELVSNSFISDVRFYNALSEFNAEESSYSGWSECYVPHLLKTKEVLQYNAKRITLGDIGTKIPKSHGSEFYYFIVKLKGRELAKKEFLLRLHSLMSIQTHNLLRSGVASNFTDILKSKFNFYRSTDLPQSSESFVYSRFNHLKLKYNNLEKDKYTNLSYWYNKKQFGKKIPDTISLVELTVSFFALVPIVCWIFENNRLTLSVNEDALINLSVTEPFYFNFMNVSDFSSNKLVTNIYTDMTAYQWGWEYTLVHNSNYGKLTIITDVLTCSDVEFINDESEDLNSLNYAQSYLLSPEQSIYATEGDKMSLTLASNDVIHCFTLPSVAIKEDCVPGNSAKRVDLSNTLHDKYSGMCSELCGKDHARMALNFTFLKSYIND